MLHCRTPEEYPENLGLVRPDMIRTDFNKLPVLNQSDRCHRRHGFVQLLTFWGIGWKSAALESDRLGMAHLGLIAATLQNVLRRGTRVILLLGDTHARANEVPDEIIQSYGDSIRKLAKEFLFSICELSSLDSVASKTFGDQDLTQEERVLYAPEQLHYEKSARHLHSDNFELRARKYFAVRYRERMIIATQFPDAVLASPDIVQRAALTPPLPTFFINILPYARLRKLKPWFLSNY
jgi:hypothetical protein